MVSRVFLHEVRDEPCLQSLASLSLHRLSLLGSRVGIKA